MKRFSVRFALLLCVFAGVFVTVMNVYSLSVGAGEANEDKGQKRGNVQVVLKARAAPPDFWRIVEMGLQMAANEFDLRIEVNGPAQETDITAQIDMMEAAIAKKPDVILLAAADYERLALVCEKALAEGIPLVIVDSDVNCAGTSCFVGTDNYELGQKLGALVEQQLGAEESFGVIGHVESSFTAIERRRGLEDTVQNCTQRLAALAYCGSSPDLAREQARGMLLENPDIACMVGLNETSALGICYALEELGLVGQVPVVACDSSEAMIPYLEMGAISACVVQNPFNMGYLGMQAAAELIRGNRPAGNINTGSVVITKREMYNPENQKLLFPFTDVAV